MGRSRYFVAGRTAAPGAVPVVVANLWNPDTSGRVIRVFYFSLVSHVYSTGGVPEVALRRTTARGTPGSTVTPDVDNHVKRHAAPSSGALLDLLPTATTVANNIRKWVGASLSTGTSGQGSGVSWWARNGLVVPAGTGLALYQLAGALVGWDIDFGWDE